MKKFTVHAMLVLVVVSVLFRGLLFGYETYGFMAVISLLSFLYFFSKIRNNEVIHIHKFYTALSILLIAAYALASVHAVNPGVNIGSILLYTELAIVFHVLYDYFNEKQQHLIREIMWMVVITGFIAAVIGLEALTYSFSFLDITIFDKTLGSTFQYRNTAAIYLSICIMFALTFINILKNPILKTLLTGAGSIFILALFMTVSRGGWLVGSAIIFVFLLIQPGIFKINSFFSFISMMIPFAITYNKYNSYAAAHDYINASIWMAVSFISAAVLYSVFLFLAWLIKKYLLKGNELQLPGWSGILSFAIFAGAVVCVLVFWQQFVSILPQELGNRLKNLNLNDKSFLYRLEFDMDALKLIKENWFAGLGGGGWQARHQSIQDVFYIVTFPHNYFIQIFVEAGIFGFLSFILLVLASFIKLLLAFIKTVDKIHKAAISGILCGFAALAIHSSFDLDLNYTSLTLLLWVLFTIAAVKIENSNDIINKNSVIQNRFIKVIPILICAILISMNSLYFTAANNVNQALKYTKSSDYKTAALFYEEAVRLDPRNSEYTSELSKIYLLLADSTQNDGERKSWLDKAITTGEQCISSNRYYSEYVKTLVRIYISANNPEKVLEYSQLLVSSQRCYGNNYEVLARAYLGMANYYIAEKNSDKAKQMLNACIAIENDPNLIKTKRGISFRMTTRIENDNKPGAYLEKYVNDARELLKKIN